MLKEYSDACKQVAVEKGITLIDLHGKSVNFILKNGAKKLLGIFILRTILIIMILVLSKWQGS